MKTTESTAELELAPVQPGEPPMKQLAPYDEFKAKIESLKKTAETITVTDISQTAEMKIARATRLSLREIRVAITHRHKELKADILEAGRAIDAGKNELLAILEPLEMRLKDQEDFAERKAAEELRLKVQRRTEQLSKLWNPDVPLPDLGVLTDNQFDTLLADTETTHKAKLVAAQKAREEAEAAAAKAELRRQRSMELAPLARFITVKLDDLGEMTFETYAGILNDAKAAEKVEKEEQERQRLENERLKKEAAEREEQIKREQAERERIARIDDAILGIREGETDALRICRTAEETRREIEYVEKRPITAEIYQEKLEEAKAVHAAVLKSMRSILAEREAAEAAEAKARTEREKAEAEAKAERERIEREHQAKLEAERKAAAEKARIEREAREKAERELAAKKAEEAARLKAEQEAAKKAARLPDREKLTGFAQRVETLTQGIPSFASEECKAMRFEITRRLNDVRDWLRGEADKLS